MSDYKLPYCWLGKSKTVIGQDGKTQEKIITEADVNLECQCAFEMQAFFCATGHMTECHYPMTCDEAKCSHLSRYDAEPISDDEAEELAADLGPCCVCDGSVNVRNIMMLHKKALTIPGSTWGCVVCHLPYEGAVAVICDACLESKAEIRFAVDGYLEEKKRVKIEELTIEHKHDMKFHQDEMNLSEESEPSRDGFEDIEEDCS